MKELKRQQEKVCIPLVAECTKRENQCQNMFQEVTERTKSLKILFAMIRSPKICDLVYKTERKRLTAENFKAMQESAVLTLRQYKFDEKQADKFVEEIYSRVDKQVNHDLHKLRADPPRLNSASSRASSPPD